MRQALRDLILVRRCPPTEDQRAALYLKVLGRQAGSGPSKLSDDALVMRLSDAEERAIAKDLHRVGWTSMTADGTGYPLGLARVLRVVLRDAGVPYNQAMSYIGAFALVLVRGHESDAAALVAGLFKHLHLAPIFSTKTCFLQRLVDRFDFCFSRYLPELFENFRVVQFNTLFFALEWFTTLFTSSLAHDACIAVWDFVILCDYDDGLFLVALALLSALQPVLLTMNEADVMLGFKPLVRALAPHQVLDALRDAAAALENSYLIPKASSTLRAMETRDPGNQLVNASYDATFFMRAVQLDDAERARDEAAKYAFPLALLNYALFRACLLGHGASAHVVLQAGADVNCRAGTMRPVHAAALLGHADVMRTLKEHGAHLDVAWAECTPRQVVETCCKVMNKHVPSTKAWLFATADLYTWYHTALVLDGALCARCGAEHGGSGHVCVMLHWQSFFAPAAATKAPCRVCGVKPKPDSVECAACRGSFCAECAGTFRVVHQADAAAAAAAAAAGVVRMCNTCLHFAGACACGGVQLCEHQSRSLSGKMICECPACLGALVKARGPRAMVDWMTLECVTAFRALEKATRGLLNES